MQLTTVWEAAATHELHQHVNVAFVNGALLNEDDEDDDDDDAKGASTQNDAPGGSTELQGHRCKKTFK